MQLRLNKTINYFNEALLLATYTCNSDRADDLGLPIDYDKMVSSQTQIDKDYQWFVSFLEIIRIEVRVLLAKYKELERFFQKANDNILKSFVC